MPNFNIPVNNQSSSFDYSGLAESMANATTNNANKPNIESDPSAALRRTFTDNVQSFIPYSGGIANPYIMGDPLSYESRAQNQSGLKLFGNATAQFFLGELAGGTISGMGTLSRPDKFFERVFEGNNAWDKGILESLGDWIQEETRNKFPIYQTEAAQKGVAWTDASWYASMAPSMASALSILIPARAASMVSIEFAKILRESGKLGKVIKVAELAGDAERVAKYSKLANTNRWTELISSAVAGRVIDSTRESLGKYSEYYNEYRNNGMSDIQARQEAGEAASKGFRYSGLNIVFDLVEWGTILKMGNYANKEYMQSLKKLLYQDARYSSEKMLLGSAETASKRLSGIALDMFKTGAAEGADEMTMDIFQNEGKYQQDVEHGRTAKTTFGERLGQHLETRKNWDSFIGGVAGGLFMLPFGKVTQNLFNKDLKQQMKDQINAIIANAEQTRSVIEQIDKAITDGDHERATILKDSLISNIASKSYVNGTLDYDLEMLRNLSHLNSKQIEEQGLNPSIVEFAKDIHENVQIASDIFTNEMDNIRLYDENGNPDPANFAINQTIAQLKVDMTIAKKRMDEFKVKNNYDTIKSDLEVDSHFTGLSKEYFNHLVEYNNALDTLKNKEDLFKEAIAGIEKKIKLNEETIAKSTGFVKLTAETNIKGLKATIESINKTFDEINQLRNDLKSKFEVSKKAFEGIDEKGNRLLTDETLKSIDDYFTENVKDDTKRDIKNKVSAFEAELEVKTKMLNHYVTKKGMLEIKDYVSKLQDNHRRDIESDVDELLAGVNTLDELETVKKNLKKTNFDPKTYSEKVSKKEKELKGKKKVEEEDARRAAHNATVTSETSREESVAEPSPAVPASSASPVESKTSTTTEVITSNIENLLSGVKQYNPRNLKAFSEAIAYIDSNNLDESDLNKIFHTLILLDIVLNKDNVELLNDPRINGKSLLDIAKVFENVDIDSTTKLGQLIEGLNYYSGMLGEYFKIVPSNNNTKFFITGMADDSLGLDMLNDILTGVDPKLLDNLDSNYNSYLSTLETQFSTSFENITDEDTQRELNQKTIDEISKYVEVDFVGDPENPISLGYNIHETLNVAARVYRQLLDYRKNTLNNANTVVKIKDILKYLRDIDRIHENYNEVIYGLYMYKIYINMRVKDITRRLNKLGDTARDRDTKRYMEIELDRLNKMDSSLDLSDIKIDKLKDEINDSFIEDFLKYNPKQHTETVPKSGVKAVLNTYDEEGNPIELEHSDITELSTSTSIYEDLSKLKSGVDVEYVIDREFKHVNSPEEYTWQDQPIRVKIKNADGTSKATVLFIRSLKYQAGGIQYSKFENGAYVFHGVSDVMNDQDYNNVFKYFSVLKEFYYNYRQSFANNKNVKDKDSHKKAMDIAYNKLKQISELQSTFVKIINQNLPDDEKVDSVTRKNIISVLDAVFYKVRIEDLEEKTTYSPNVSIIKNTIRSRDEAYKNDFNLNKQLRIDIQNGIVKEGTIGYVSTPPVLHMDDNFTASGMPAPRYTLDMTIKPITLGKKNTNPRIVLIKNIEGNYYDLETGELVDDPRFDGKKYINRNMFRDRVSDNMQVLLEAPNGKLIPFDVKANTIGSSYLDDTHRANAIDTIFAALDRIRQAGTAGEDTATDSLLKHITIDDSKLSKERADASTREIKFLETFVGTDDSRITVSIPHKGYMVYVNIVFRNGKVTFYRSPKKIDTIETRYANGTIKRAGGSRFMSADDYNIDLNTDKGYALYETKMKELIPHMLRQTHIDMKNHKFTYDKNYDGGEVFDPITNQTYKSAKDFYIQTGAIYSRVNAVYSSNGKILTNFDLRGNSPMTVTLEHKRLINKDYSVDYVSELVGKDKLINPNDPYLNLVLGLEERLIDKLGKIYVMGGRHSTNPDASAVLIQEPDYPGIFSVGLFHGYHKERLKGDVYRPAILNIAHEFIHTYMNSRYRSRINESEDSKKTRYDNIAYHNEQMIEFYKDLKAEWDSKNDIEKEAFVKDLFKSSTNVAKNNTYYFEQYLNYISDEITRVTESVVNKLNKGEDLDYIDTIQEPITMAYSNPIVSVILNNLNASKNGETFKVGVKNSFWNKLINKFLAILERLLNTDVKDTYKYKLNHKNQLAKLNAMVNSIFDARMKRNIIETSDSKTKYKTEKKVEEVGTESTTESEIIFDEEAGIEYKINLEDVEQASDEDTKDFLGGDYIPEDDQYSTSFSETIISDSVIDNSKSSDQAFEHIRANIDPEKAILDGLNLPIC